MLSTESNSNWFNNRTEIDFPYEVKLILSPGKKYALQCGRNELPVLDLIEYGLFNGQSVPNFRMSKEPRYANLFAILKTPKKGSREASQKYEEGSTMVSKKHESIIVFNSNKDKFNATMGKGEFQVYQNAAFFG